jgi:hypothetical protein
MGHKLLVYVDGINSLGKDINTIKRSLEYLDDNEETDLDVKAEKTG